MQFKRITISLIIISAMLLSACTSASPTSESAMQESSQSGEMMIEEGSKDAMAMDETNEGAMEMEKMDQDSVDGESGAMEDKDSMASGAHEGDMMGENQDEAMPGKESGDEAMQDESMSGEDAMKDDSMGGDAMMEAPAWFGAELVNARNGEGFRVADLKGKVVLVETMAVWCSSCLRQQQQVKTLHELLGEREDFVSLGLDIDPNEETEQLKSFIEQNDFDWIYAVSPAEVSRELGQLYGAQFLNPPSTPMLIIDRSGEVHTLPFGIKSAEELADALQPFLDEGM